MEPNKSIDGLTTRRAKTDAPSSKSTTKRIRKSPQSTLVLTPSSHATSSKATKSSRTKSTKSTSSKSKTSKSNSTKTKSPKITLTPEQINALSQTTTPHVISSNTIPTKSNKSTKSSKSKKSNKSSKPNKASKSNKAPKPNKPQTLAQPTKPVESTSDQPIPTSTTASDSQSSSSKQPESFDTPHTSADDFLKPSQVFSFDEETGELKASEANTTKRTNGDSSTNELKPKKAKKPVSKKRKIITGIILAIVLILIGIIIWVIVWGNDIIAKITGGQGSIFDLLTFTEPTYQRLKTDDNGRTNILAFGTSGYNMEGDEGNGVHDGAQLTDSIMVISLNQDTGDVAMISLPRDLKASPTCTATGKINEVYWCNNMEGDNEQAGAKALMEEVGDILGIDFQYYAHLNWGSLVQIVDTLGGIKVTLDEDIEDYYYTGAVFEAGQEYTIDGGQALGLARARHGTAGGDFSRGASQQKILIGIKNKVFEKDLSLTDLLSLASTLGDNLRTNFNVEELKSFAHLAAEFDFDAMRQISLLEPEPLMTTGTINGISYVLPSGGANYYTKIQNYITKMLSNNPSVYEDATILVLNGTNTPGLAASEEKALEDEGYANITISDAPEGKYTDNYALYSLADDKPGTLKSLESKYNLESKPSSELPAGIDTGYDFVLIIGGSPTE